MKHLHLSSTNFKYLEQGFKEWLEVLGYAERTVQGSPVQVRELFHYLEQQNIQHIMQIKSRHISNFIRHLQTRINLMYGGGLSSSSINSYITTINLFARYVNQTGKHVLDVTPKRLQIDTPERMILTREEISRLYEATYEPHATFNSLAMGQRDRAIIAIFYGCGLRKQEGSSLNLSDIDLIKRLVFVKKGKGNKQRYVPIATRHVEDLRSYIEEGRYWFMQDNRTAWHTRQGIRKQGIETEALFLNGQGRRMQDFCNRLRYMQERSGIEKHFSTHNLRHSIATHLLQSGMPIEEIAKFLGHATLDSTQIYTHIVQQLNSAKTGEYEFTEF